MLKPLKFLGQNYLQDKNILNKIAEAINIKKEDLILEIGPGTGALTEFILKYKPKKLIAIDIDHRVQDTLKQRFKENFDNNFNFVLGDITKFNIVEKFNIENNCKIKVCGNIPYYLTANILFYIIENRNNISSCILMIQKEVAQRIVAEYNNKNYGILSVILQLCSNVKILFDVSPNCFYPKPKVMSSVLKIDFFHPLQLEYFDEFVVFVKTIFNKRRKIIKNNFDKELEKLLSNSNTNDFIKINISRRAEELSPLEIYKLFIEIKKINGFVQ